MKKLKLILTGIVIGLLLGLWFGVNIGKEQHIFSNPFATKNISQQLKSKAGETVERAGKGIERLGEDIKGRTE
jgi:ABC-type lipoprotein release transport system permease subunit